VSQVLPRKCSGESISPSLLGSNHQTKAGIKGRTTLKPNPVTVEQESMRSESKDALEPSLIEMV
jgi:hypothetical protein